MTRKPFSILTTLGIFTFFAFPYANTTTFQSGSQSTICGVLMANTKVGGRRTGRLTATPRYYLIQRVRKNGHLRSEFKYDLSSVRREEISTKISGLKKRSYICVTGILEQTGPNHFIVEDITNVILKNK